MRWSGLWIGLMLTGCGGSDASGTDATGDTDAATDTETSGEDDDGGDPLPAIAEVLLTNAVVITADLAVPRAEAVGIADGRIQFVGSAKDAAAVIGDNTEVIDMEGRTVLPGLHDVHTHLLEAFVEPASTCLLPPGQPLPSYATRLTNCKDDQVGTDWLLGWGFSIDQALQAPNQPRAILDAIVPDQPVAIMEETSHAVWVNTKALEVLGFDVDGPDPTGGIVVRTGKGEATGLLIDAAGEAAFDAALAQTTALDVFNEAALREGIARANSWGITSVGDARAYWQRGYVDAWKAVEAKGDLSLKASVALWAYPELDDVTQIADLKALYRNEPGARLRFDQVKIYADGLLQATTAATLEPYESPTLGPDDGLNVFDVDRLTTYATELSAAGFAMHIHAIGDRGVREALDALEAAGTANAGEALAPDPVRHRLTHVEWVHPDDVPRFAALGVTADLQMSFRWVEPEFLDANHPYMGKDRTDERAWRLADLWDSKANVTLSSDFDVGSMSPFKGMARALDRGPQSLPDLDAAVRAYTINGARLLGQSSRTGSLTPGKAADLAVVDRDLTTTDALGDAEVVWVLLDGDVVYENY